MRKLLVATFVALIMAGCGGYSGPYTWTWPNGQKFGEVHFKNGKKNGPYTGWYKDGKKSSEGSYKNGKKDGLMTRYSNGQKEWEGTYKADNLISSRSW